MCLKILNKFAVIDKTSLSIATIYRLMSKDLFPKQIKMSMRSVGWLESDIDLSIWARNLFDKDYLGTYYDVPLQSGKVNAYQREPRTYGVSLRKNF